MKAVNKNSNNYLLTPVNISRFSFELLHHPDITFTNNLLTGLKRGFNPGVKIICNNLQYAFAEPDIIDNLIKKEVS